MRAGRGQRRETTGDGTAVSAVRSTLSQCGYRLFTVTDAGPKEKRRPCALPEESSVSPPPVGGAVPGPLAVRRKGSHRCRPCLPCSCFSADSVEQIIDNLQRDGSPFALEQVKVKPGALLQECGGCLGQGPPGGQAEHVVAVPMKPHPNPMPKAARGRPGGPRRHASPPGSSCPGSTRDMGIRRWGNADGHLAAVTLACKFV